MPYPLIRELAGCGSARRVTDRHVSNSNISLESGPLLIAPRRDPDPRVGSFPRLECWRSVQRSPSGPRPDRQNGGKKCAHRPRDSIHRLPALWAVDPLCIRPGGP